ncbi:MAG: NPCBM/NEW2 domain-containing protein [Planctomycetes bacterium]|nr:NPCBM/NEW2 domain-containing protein [Planctomycetota bacterium]
MAQRLFLTAAVVFTLVSQPPSLRAQDDTSPSSPETKKRGGLYDLLAPADREKKAPIPPRAEREKARELIREAFGRPDTAKERAALAQTLIKAGLDDKNPANRYVALRHAGELAVENADLAVASEAADRLGEFFDVDVLTIKASIVERLFGKVAHRKLLDAATSHFGEALAADRFEVAARFGRVGYKAAKALKDRPQIAAMRQSAARLKGRKAAFDALTGAIATLKQKPDDAPANLQIGKYLCFLRGDWKRGLALLVKGGHAIAKQESAVADDPSAQKKVGDAWWDLAETKTGHTKTHIKARAVKWYQRASPKLAGLSKLTAQRRVDDVLRETAALARNDDRPGGKKSGRYRKKYLDDLKEVSHKALFFGKNGATGYPRVSVSRCKFRGVNLTHAIALHPRTKSSAHIIYDLGGKYSSLLTGVGIIEGAGVDSSSPLTFKVYGDGKILWQSRPLQKRNDGQDCKISIRGVRQLKLEVNCPGILNGAHAAWINPVISK